MRRMSYIELFEIVIRGAAVGVLVLLAVALLLKRPLTNVRLCGGLFNISTATYVLLSGDGTRGLFGDYAFPVSFIAVYGTVFFWWFAAAFFDDEFQWRWWRFTPLIFLPMAHIGHDMASANALEAALWYSHIGVNILMFTDAFRLAVTNAADDLVNPRRRFRVVIAATVATFGLAIAAAEIIERDIILPDGLLLAQGIGIFVLSMIFGVWLLRPDHELLGERVATPSVEGAPARKPALASSADQPAYDKLTALMDAGIYREEGLSVARLAEKVGVPEHQLRRLINQEMGFRNFSAFLNARRIEDAKSLLADPSMAKKQVLQIALELGYASIAPFNRAFKAATDQTPTEYRKKKLNNG